MAYKVYEHSRVQVLRFAPGMSDACHKILGVYNTHMGSNDLIKRLTKAGWTLDRVNGSHHIYRHPTKPGHISVPHPKKDLGKGLVAKILKFAGLTP